MYQVKKLFSRNCLVRQLLRYTHSEPKPKPLYPLKSRSLLKVSGKDAGVFLQGLITNDMEHFEEGTKSMYTMFLNNKGRVMYDVLIHKWQKEDSFMIECDKNVLSMLQKHLRIYKLKRAAEIEDVSKDYKLWVLISDAFVPESGLTNDIDIYKDPRLSDLGFRIIGPSSILEEKITEVTGKDTTVEKNEDGYKYLRYKFGVSEGADDLPPGTCFPLECNCDYLHGVSFHKGCYIGQELTARVHHTGVVRKRIMPIQFLDAVKENLEKDSTINATDNLKANIGKLKGNIQDYGIGLVRIKEAQEAKSLVIGKYTAKVLKPSWWPLEAPKEKASLTKLV
ncbi:hypothetical protein K1T71_010889 [Dendrolimus kikuchii]|uniref:Uncharacterized protein n=1 Tax=Dendrolimus kikuchii TaxID=765133 RepID=A0ACC1CQF0_9NEOP|nr:hypothetical protein K1T71_010889 [Dendrolimus kikuchii]